MIPLLTLCRAHSNNYNNNLKIGVKKEEYVGKLCKIEAYNVMPYQAKRYKLAHRLFAQLM